MDSHKLSFCKINKLNDFVAETIVNEGVEIDLEMVDEYHCWIAENLKTPGGLLINRINKYAYTFEAQLKIGDLDRIKAVAVVVYSRISEVSTRLIKTMPRAKKLNLEMFEQRDEALRWLEAELGK